MQAYIPMFMNQKDLPLVVNNSPSSWERAESFSLLLTEELHINPDPVWVVAFFV